MTSQESAELANDEQQDSLPTVVQKPLLRGWIHLIATPVALVAGLIAVAQPAELYARLSVAVFVLCSVTLFGASAVYHLGNWEPTRRAILRRIRPLNIYLLIAGTYTPLAVLLLEPETRTLLLGIIWPGALLGIALRQFWISTTVGLCSDLCGPWLGRDMVPARHLSCWRRRSRMACGSGRPPVYRWRHHLCSQTTNWFRYTFGFHETFHVCTVLGWALHFVAIAASW